jgi:hypothetical protein
LSVTAQEGLVLAFVSAPDGVPVTAIVRLVRVSKSMMTSLLQRRETASSMRRGGNPTMRDHGSGATRRTIRSAGVDGSAKNEEAFTNQRMDPFPRRNRRHTPSALALAASVEIASLTYRRRVPR